MDKLKMQLMVLGDIGTNCYILSREGGAGAVIIDPADNAPFIQKRLSQLGLRPEAVLLTHGHFDHIMAAGELKAVFGCPVCAGAAEAELLADPMQNLTAAFGGAGLSIVPDRLFADGESFSLLGFDWQVFFTPGHTAGSAVYYIASEQVLFCGDTLFFESFGRTDLPTASPQAIIRSLAEVVFSLPDSVQAFPGHGQSTTIGHEKQHNPVLRYRGYTR